MSKMDETCNDLGAVMIENAPAELKAETNDVIERRAKAFKIGMVAFANATGGEDHAGDEDNDSP